MKIWCLFEQSGTFKNEFKKFGFEAYDVDILNDFKQTDFEFDLFANIAAAASGEKSLFDNIHADDLVFAFFPCTKFTEKHYMNARGDNFFLKNYTPLQHSLRISLKISTSKSVCLKSFKISTS